MRDVVADSFNSKSKDNRYKEVYIGYIIPSRFNTYPMVEISTLAENILETGLMHPISLLKINDHHYEILSGERRYRAMKMLYEEGHDEYETIKAMVRIVDMDDIEKKRMIRRGNATRPDLSVQQKIDIVKDSLADYTRSKERKEVSTGTLKRDWIAMDTGFSKSSVQSYLNIIEGKQETVTRADEWKNDPHLQRVKKRFEAKLQTKVQVTNKEIKIKYLSIDDLNRLLEALDMLEEDLS